MTYSNPIIKGFHPDPSVCKVGNEYFLVVSTFEYFPGISIFRSTDLINWEQISSCITRPEQLSFERFKSSGGIWAPTIRFNNGRFYITATVDGKGNMIVHTDDIYGEWSNPVWVKMGGIDPSILFDNGKCCYCTNARGSDNREAISAAEINPDTGELLSEPVQIWYGIGEGWLEGPHIYHINDWYYILTSEGGTSYNHMISLGRSKELFGKYESCPENPIMTNRNDTTKQVQCAGHGDFIEGSDGNWYMVHLATRSCIGNRTPLGREVFLTPIKFENGWVSIKDKKAFLENNSDMGIQKPDAEFRADFDKTTWENEFKFIRTPKQNAYSRGNGFLAVKPSCGSFDVPNNPSFVGIVQPDFNFECNAKLNFTPLESGDEAGLILYLQADTYIRLAVKRENDKNYITVLRVCDDMYMTGYKDEIGSDDVYLKISGDKEKYHFYYSLNGKNYTHMCDASLRFMCVQTASRCFTGTFIGMYALCEKKTAAEAKFYSFNVK